MTAVLIRKGNVDTDTEERPCEDIGRSWPLTSQGEGPQGKLLHLISDF